MGRIPHFRAVASLATATAALLFCGCHSLHPNVPATQVPLPTPLNNTDVISMSANGLSDDTIIRTMQTQPTAFDVTPAALIDLKANGVSDRVLQAMQGGRAQPAMVLVEPPPPAVVVEPSIHFGMPFFVGRPWHHHHHHRHHHRRHPEPRFSMSFWHGW